MNTIQSNNPINTVGLCACPLCAYNYSSLTPSFYSAAQLDHWDKYLRANGVKSVKVSRRDAGSIPLRSHDSRREMKSYHYCQGRHVTVCF